MSDPLILFAQAQGKADAGDLDGAIALADQAMEVWDAEDRAVASRGHTGLVTVVAHAVLVIGIVGLVGQIT